MSFTRQILIGLVLGIFTGLFLGERVGPLSLIAEGFIKLLQMTVLPYVTISIVSSLGSLNIEDAKRLGRRAGAVLLSLWGLALLFTFVMPLAFPRTQTASFFSTTLVSPHEPLSVIDLYIPANPFHALANNIVPAVVLFSVILGIAIIGLDRKHVLLDVLTTASQAVARATRFVVRLTPIGIFAIAANAAGTLDLEKLQRLEVYLVTYMAIALLVALWVLPGLVAALTPIPYRDVLAPTRDALITAFMAGDLFIVLPILIGQCKELLARHGITDQHSASVPDVLVPTSFNFPHTGKLISLSFILFAGWFSGAPLPIAEYPRLALTGVLTFFGSLNAAVPFLLDLFHIPADTFQLFLASGVVNARFGSLLAAVHTVAFTLIGTAAVVGALRVDAGRLTRYLIVTGLLTAATIIGLRLGFETVLGADFKGRQMVYGLRPVFEHAPTIVRAEPPPTPAETMATSSTMDRIRARGHLAVAVLTRNLPYAFLNDDKQLVGLDVEMAHRFARDLGVGIEFVTTRIEDLPGLLRERRCDIAMSGVPITPRRSETMRFSQPYLDETMAFMVRDHLRSGFATWEGIRQLGATRIGTFNVPYYIMAVRDRAPALKLEPIPADVDPLTTRPRLDAYLLTAERGSVMTLLYPEYAIVVPMPDPVKVPLAYPLTPGDGDWAAIVNNWIELKRRDGTIDVLFRHWIMGQSRESRQPRWSIMQDVLHWVE
jgi:Na+/H+-dicarboxylate symporter